MRLRVGVIGLGWMGRLHARSYRAVGEHFPELDAVPELVLAADPLAENRALAVRSLGFADATPDWWAVLEAVDVVSVCVPNDQHRQIAVAAAGAGIPLWIEKPMGAGVGDSRAIAGAVAERGLMTAVGFNYRHAPAIAHARELITSGRLGRVTSVRTALLADYAAAAHAPLTWRYDRARAGSGVVGDLLSHGVDLAHFLVGPISEVTAMSDTVITQRPVPGGGSDGASLGPVQNEDWIGALARFDSGAVGTFEASRVATGPRAQYTVEVYGTAGSLRWDFQRLNELQVALAEPGPGGTTGLPGYTTVLAGPEHGEFARFQPGAGTSMGFDDLKVIEAAGFLTSVRTGRQHGPSVADGLAAAEVCHAILASAADGTWHTVRA